VFEQVSHRGFAGVERRQITPDRIVDVELSAVYQRHQ